MAIKQSLTRKKVWLTFAGIVILAIFSVLTIYPNLPANIPGYTWFNKFAPKLGLDLQGGAHLIYEGNIGDLNSSDAAAAMEGVRDVIERRVNAFGVSEPIVQVSGDNRLIVELAGVFDVNEAIKQIGETPLLEFKEQNPEASATPELTAEQQADMDEYNKQAEISARDILARIKAGEDFATLAAQYSEDPGSKDNGGDLGFAKKGSYVTEFEKAIWEDLNVGEVTPEPVKTQFGYHIIKKDEVRGEGEDQEIRASHILIATKSIYDYVTPVDQWLPAELTGKHLQRSEVVFDPQTGAPTVSLKFNDEGKDLFADITARNINKPVAIFLDGSAISIPTVSNTITQGEAIISGSFDLEQAKLLAQRLNAGALPISISLISEQTVGPTLGQISLSKSLVAGLIGLALVALFMLIFYRLPGFLSVIALAIYTAIALAIFIIWPITLTLAGIAGFILSIGMAVDANVLIFERMREELRNEKPLASAIEDGFTRAWASIRDSNISSLITCFILIWFGSGIIKGFALTLGIGIIVSMFSAIIITRTFLRLLSKSLSKKSLWWFNASIKK
ncbi:MAG: protein translocase subunit SecD [Candidatus Komeilibacteria bacterium]